MAGQTKGGVRYFARLHGTKDPPTSVGTCCEGQSVRTFGAAPEFIFSVGVSGAAAQDAGRIFVNIYEAATLSTTAAASTHELNSGTTSVPATVSIVTDWPFDSRVSVLAALEGEGTGAPATLPLSLRIPVWAQPTQSSLNGTVVVLVDGVAVASGVPGTFVDLMLTLPADGTAVNATFQLLAAPAAILYTGVTQMPPLSRYAYTFGPFLLAAVGNWDWGLDCGVINGSAVPGFDPKAPAVWLQPPDRTPQGALPAAGTDFSVSGVPGVLLRPYYAVGDERFTAFPVVVPGSG
jgi:hypothetical protein